MHLKSRVVEGYNIIWFLNVGMVRILVNGVFFNYNYVMLYICLDWVLNEVLKLFIVYLLSIKKTI